MVRKGINRILECAPVQDPHICTRRCTPGALADDPGATVPVP